MAKKTYRTTWRNKWLTASAKSIDEMVTMLRDAATQLEQMAEAGVELENSDSTEDDYADLVTDKPAVARRFNMQLDE